MAKLVAGIVVSFGLLVGGCSSSGAVKSVPSDASAGATESVGSDTAGSTTEPVPDGSGPQLFGPLTIQLDTATATQSIGPDGGTVAVTSSTGTAFSLVIPEGALLWPVDITATPVAAFGNLGFDADGVVFGPTGLTLSSAAKLTITPTTPVPVERQLMFAFDDSGAQFGSAEPQIDTPDVVIMVEHFSGYAFGDATRPSQAAFLQRQATEAAARISGQVGDVFQSERQSQLLTGESIVDLAAAFEAYGKQWEELVIKPRLDAANSSLRGGNAGHLDGTRL